MIWSALIMAAALGSPVEQGRRDQPIPRYRCEGYNERFFVETYWPDESDHIAIFNRSGRLDGEGVAIDDLDEQKVKRFDKIQPFNVKFRDHQYDGVLIAPWVLKKIDGDSHLYIEEIFHRNIRCVLVEVQNK
ncbi:MAG: hypothetical protein ABL881_12205 [Novosphingobium sp.]